MPLTAGTRVGPYLIVAPIGAGGMGEVTDLYWHDNSAVRDFSPDGSQILFSEGAAAAGTDWVTYMRNTDGSPAVRLGDGLATAFSPDGKWAMTNPAGPKAPLMGLPTHAGSARTLSAGDIRHFGGRWLHDGKRIVFVGSEPGHRLRYYVQEGPESAPRAISAENIVFDRFADQIVTSPDGKSVAAVIVDTGIQLLPIDGGAPRSIPGTIGFAPTAWCRDGGLLMTRPGETYAYTAQYDPSTLFVVSGAH